MSTKWKTDGPVTRDTIAAFMRRMPDDPTLAAICLLNWLYMRVEDEYALVVLVHASEHLSDNKE